MEGYAGAGLWEGRRLVKLQTWRIFLVLLLSLVLGDGGLSGSGLLWAVSQGETRSSS